MIKNDKKLTSYQLVILLLCSLFGVGILQLPAGLAETTGSEAWIVVILSGLIIIFSVFLMCKMGSLYDDNGLVDASRKNFGKVLGVILVVPILICLFIGLGTVTEIFSMAIRIFLLDRTPNYAIVIPFLFLIMILTRGKLKDMINFFQVVVPFVSIFLILIYMLAIPGADFTNLLPVFQREPKEYLSGIQICLFSYGGILNLVVLYPYIEKREIRSTFKYSGISLGIVALFYMITNALCLAKLGVGETKWLIHPTVSLIKSAFIPGGFVERLEGVLMSVWVIIVFSTLCIIIYSTSVIISDIFEFKHSKLVVTILIPIIYFLSTSVVSVLDMHIINRMNDVILGIYSIFIFPLLFIIVNRIRFKKRGVNNVD